MPTLPAVLGLALIAGISPRAAGAADVPAVVERLIGEVEISRTIPPAWFEASPGAASYPGDRVRTRAGAVELLLPDRSRVRLRRDTELAVTRLAEGARWGTVSTLLDLAQGAVRALVRPLRRGATFSIASASAITAVKGTAFVFDGRAVTVLDEHDPAVHRVALTSRAGRAAVLVDEGMTAAVGADGLIAAPRPAAVGDLQRLEDDFAMPDEVAGPSLGSPVPELPGGLIPRLASAPAPNLGTALPGAGLLPVAGAPGGGGLVPAVPSAALGSGGALLPQAGGFLQILLPGTVLPR